MDDSSKYLAFCVVPLASDDDSNDFVADFCFFVDSNFRVDLLYLVSTEYQLDFYFGEFTRAKTRPTASGRRAGGGSQPATRRASVGALSVAFGSRRGFGGQGKALAPSTVVAQIVAQGWALRVTAATATTATNSNSKQQATRSMDTGPKRRVRRSGRALGVSTYLRETRRLEITSRGG